MLHSAAAAFATQSSYQIVEPAHMELAAPTIAEAFARCAEQGATRVIVFPYFLSPGRHWTEDIPALVAKAAESFPGISWLVTAPFGLHPRMLDVINDRIRLCEQAAIANEAGTNPANCDVCHAGHMCMFRTSADSD